MKVYSFLSRFELELAKIPWEDWLMKGSLLLIKLVLFYFLFLITKLFANKLIKTIFQRIQHKDQLSASRTKTLESLAMNLVGYMLTFILIVTVLQLFEINVSAILAGAGIVGLAVGFGAQGLVSDVVTGFFIFLERQIDVGDDITTSSYSGIVEQVGLRTTQVRGYDGTLHFIPNREIKILSNRSRGDMRALIDIEISNQFDWHNIKSVIQSACDQEASKNDLILQPPTILGVQSLGSANFVIRITCITLNGAQFEVERQLRKVIKKAIDQYKQTNANTEA